MAHSPNDEHAQSRSALAYDNRLVSALQDSISICLTTLALSRERRESQLSNSRTRSAPLVGLQRRVGPPLLSSPYPFSKAQFRSGSPAIPSPSGSSACARSATAQKHAGSDKVTEVVPATRIWESVNSMVGEQT